MKLTKLSIVASVAALVISSSAFAATPGFFAGVNVGYGITHADTVAPVTVKRTGIAYGINGGYNFNNYFGVEGQANRDANAKYQLNGVTTATNKVYNAAVLADGYLPVGYGFDLVGKAGVAYVKATPFTANTKKTFYRPTVAAGVMYTVTDNVGVSATYSRIFKQGSLTSARYLPNVDVAAVSVDYLF